MIINWLVDIFQELDRNQNEVFPIMISQSFRIPSPLPRYQQLLQYEKAESSETEHLMNKKLGLFHPKRASL